MRNIASFIAESICEFREAKAFVKIVGDAGEEFMPQEPPISLLTACHFRMWMFFDVRFGSCMETIGKCMLRVAPI
ncbi:MAG: hypothetical protein OXC72_09860, partial [Roseovarius sp.]|nr:hypothetical protein [Roseovarius sp.]